MIDYTRLLKDFGHSYKSVGWSSLDSQHARFHALSESCDWEGKQVLDVGCGLGDLYDFIKRRHPSTGYTGFDELPSMIEHAQNAYPSGLFTCNSLATFPTHTHYDYVLSSGAFNFRQEGDQYAFLHKHVQQMVALSTQSTALTLLSDYLYRDPAFKSSYYYYNAERVKACLGDLGEVFIKSGYLLNDFTVVILRDPQLKPKQ